MTATSGTPARAVAAARPLADLKADIAAGFDAPPRRAELIMRVLLTTRLQAVLLLRLGQWARIRVPPLAPVLKYLNLVITGADIALEAEIGPGLRLWHPNGVVVGPRCVIGAGCTLMQQATLGESGPHSPRLGDDVFIGAGARLFGDVSIGDRSNVGANAVVTRSFGPDVFLGGVPAKMIRGPE